MHVRIASVGHMHWICDTDALHMWHRHIGSVAQMQCICPTNAMKMSINNNAFFCNVIVFSNLQYRVFGLESVYARASVAQTH